MKATQKHYTEQQEQLLPTGFAWSREPDGVVNRILQGFSIVWARVHNRALALIEEADPTTTKEMLPDWEKNLGLPDECTKNTATTLQERRAAVMEKYTGKGNQAVNTYYKLAEDLGYLITIQEHKPFVCGISRCGASGDILNGGHNVRFVWTVRVHGPRVTRFRCGASAPPERLCKFTRAEDLECKIKKYAYAHTFPVINYEEFAQ